QVGHVEKWQLALDMIDETRSWGIEVPQVIADGGYGDTAAFRLGLEERGLDYVVGISTTTTAQPEDAQPCIPSYSGRGPRPVPAYPEPAQRVKSLVRVLCDNQGCCGHCSLVANAASTIRPAQSPHRVIRTQPLRAQGTHTSRI
ncbi:transposase, partial [Streptomyces sp. NPDC057600]|uniref:transposase n=1 Tax=Streptomyces sp. NPDC057600 TaxID=3346180 RepID=UPI0036C081E6